MYTECPPTSSTGPRSLDEAKELEHELLIDRRGVSNALAKEALQLGAVAVNVLRVRSRGGARLLAGQREAEDVGPLLEGLGGALGADEGVGVAVVDLHAGAAAGVARVRVADKVAPLLGGVLQALGARLVLAHGGGAGGAGEARVRRARVGGAGLEHVRVRARHDVGHHAARRRAHDVDLFLVALVLVERVRDHGHDAARVAARAVRQAGRAVHVPAVVHVGRAGVDDDEALLVGDLVHARVA